MAKIKTLKIKLKDREATEERILLAAKQIISKFGFKGATTRMIAKKADVNIALIARYFDGKYGLLLKIIEKKSIEINSGSLPYPPQNSLTEECLAFAKHRMNIFTEDLPFFRIVLAQFLTDAKFLKQFQESLSFAQIYPDFEVRLNKLIADKKLASEASIYSIHDTIGTFIFGLVVASILIKNDPEEKIKEELQHFILAYCSQYESIQTPMKQATPY